MKKILIYFVQGLIITVPVAITGYVFYKIIALIGSFVHMFGTIVSPFVDPFIVIAITLGLIFLMGLLTMCKYIRWHCRFLRYSNIMLMALQPTSSSFMNLTEPD